MQHEISEIRAFNRFYTGQIGILDSGHLQTRFSLGEARLIWEVARSGTTSAAELSRIMRLDPGQVSRMVAKLRNEGFLALAPNRRDKRQSDISLTREGEVAYVALDAASNEVIQRLLEDIPAERRAALVAAMRTIRRVLADEGATRDPVVLRSHRIGELGWLVHRQGLLYNQQYGWNGDFEALIARIYNEFHFAPDTPPKNLWVADKDGDIAGSIFCMPSDGIEGSAQLRMLYVEPWARGQGVGRALVEQCVAFARDAGYERMRLWTHEIQVAARKLYAAAGFRIVEEWDHESFGKQLHAEIWELRF